MMIASHEFGIESFGQGDGTAIGNRHSFVDRLQLSGLLPKLNVHVVTYNNTEIQEFLDHSNGVLFG